MNYKLIAFALLGLLEICNGQITFKNFYNRTVYGEIAELSNGRFLTLEGGGFIKLNFDGSINFEKHYSLRTFGPLGIFKAHENLYLIYGDGLDSCADFPTSAIAQAGLIKVDSSGTLLSANYYKPNGSCGGVPVCSEFTVDGHVLLGGRSAGSLQFLGPNAFIVRTDDFGNLLWSKHFHLQHGGVQFIKELNDKTIITGLNIDDGGGVLARLDSAGNILWSKSFIRPRGFLHSILLEPDGTFLITGNTDSVNLEIGQQYPPAFHPLFFVMKLDSLGQIIWAKQYDDSISTNSFFTLDPSRIIKLHDGNYMVLGSKHDLTGYRLQMMKLDLNGNLIWSRAHGPTGFINKCQGIIETSDQGFLMGQLVMGNFPNGSTGEYGLIKTDSIGTSVGCFEINGNINTNPYFPVDSNIILYALDGGIQYSMNIVDTSYGPSSITEECVLLKTNKYYEIEKSTQTIVYPNPSQGNFLIKQESASVANSSCLTLYDNMGKIILQRIIASEEDKKIDLSNRTKGIYILIITERDNVSKTKIIIE